MPFIKFAVSDEEYASPKTISENRNMTIQEYIRLILFHKITIFTPEEAERRALNLQNKSEPFTLPDLYSAEEWSSISAGESGVFGRRWFRFVSNSQTIDFVGTKNRRALYKVKVKVKDKDEQ